jgi:hypothetical protein
MTIGRTPRHRVDRGLIFIILAICISTVAAIDCFGQAFTANLTGVVTDPSGAAIPGGAVRIRNTATEETRQTNTGADGRYTFSQLLPGVYELTFEATGFKTFVQRSLTLLANQSATLDPRLELGATTEKIEVTAAAVQVDTQTANQSVTLSKQLVLNLPTNARNPFVLVHATAGVYARSTGIAQNTEDQNHNRIGINGGRETSSLVMIDGVSASTGVTWNGLFYAPSVDSVQEVDLIRNSYEAQFGKSGGGVVSMVTRGGSDQFHGTVFEFLRNNALDANSWSRNRLGQRNPTFQRSQFGGNLGGPLWKSKRLFFFAGYEGLRQGRPESTNPNVPTSIERQGDFSKTFNPNGTLAVIYNPFSTRSNPAGSGYIRDAFPENRIPASMFDPAGAKVAALYEQPNVPGDPITNARNFYAGGKRVSITDRFDFRVDWAHNEKHTFYARISAAPRENSYFPRYFKVANTGRDTTEPRRHFTIGNTIIPNPSWVVNILLGHGFWREKYSSHSGDMDGSEVGLPASLVRQFQAHTLPSFGIENYAGLGNNLLLDQPSRQESLQINVTKEAGAHSLKFGFTAEVARVNGGSWNSGTFNFNRGMTSGPTASTSSTVTGNGLASLLLGAGASGNVPYGPLRAITKTYYGGYFQDSWRLNRRLTLNVGLRYEVQKPPTERYNRWSNFHYDVANPLGQKVGLPLRGGLVYLDENNRYSWDTDWRDFAPRISIAYKITDKLVVRSGYGIFYPAVLGEGNTSGFSANTPWIASVGGDGLNPKNLLQNPFPDPLIQPVGRSLGLMQDVGAGVGAAPRNVPSAYTQNYSVDFQYQANADTVVELGYTGNQSRKLSGLALNDNQINSNLLSMGAGLDKQVANPFYGFITSGVFAGPTVPLHRLLRPYPHFVSVTRYGVTPGLSAGYNALVAKVTKRFSAGFSLISSYQWSKNIDNATAGQIGTNLSARNNEDISIERSISTLDIPHSWVTTVDCQLPFGRGRKFGSDLHPAADFLLGGWGVAVIARFQSGLIAGSSAPSNIGTYGFGGQFPNITSARDLAVENRVPERWFNKAAFSAPAPYTIGTAPRNLTELRGGKTEHADVAVMKSFRYRDRTRVEFRGEFFNITNTPQFSSPNTTFGNANFGQVTSTINGLARSVQFGLKLDF